MPLIRFTDNIQRHVERPSRTVAGSTVRLPQQHAYDLVFRHALDVDHTGDRLVMGSTTGSAWSSKDGGESWQTISANLPPVYAARFAPQ